jgi:toxin-antitoxin system PIN domain toxin
VSVTLDANILIYASNADDPLHDRARAVVEEVAAGPDITYLFWPALLGYVRIATHPGILPRPLSPMDAMANVEALLNRPHVRAPGEQDRFWRAFRAAAGDQARGNDVPDAHIAALMRQHGVRVIYTRDKAFRRFDGIEARDPFGPSPVTDNVMA